MNKKLILLVIVSLLSFIIVSSLTLDYQYLGFSKKIISINSTYYIDGCFDFDVLDTPKIIKDTAILEAKNQLKGNTANSPLILEIDLENSEICWKSSYEKTIEQINIIYTNKSITDNLKDSKYDLNNDKWIGDND